MLNSLTVHSPIVKQTVWHGEADTAAFAQAFVTTHDVSHAIIELRGELGAGKTTLARHLLHALGVTGRIKSPTYAILETYTARNGLCISHFDFYRFNDPQEWEDAGFRDIFAAPGLKLVEWADKAHDFMPPPNIVIEIDTLTDSTRRVTVRTG